MGYTPPQLEVRKITGGWQIFPPSLTTTDDLTISANGTDTYAKILLDGAGNIRFSHHGGFGTQFADGTTLFMTFLYTSPDVCLNPVNNKNLFLNPIGTGLVKFGAYTAGAATDSTGFITILDAAGNTRKLMVQA